MGIIKISSKKMHMEFFECRPFVSLAITLVGYFADIRCRLHGAVVGKTKDGSILLCPGEFGSYNTPVKQDIMSYDDICLQNRF